MSDTKSCISLVVCQSVVREVLQEPEAPLTAFTLKGLLARVDAHVFGEVALVVELLPALFTAVGFLPRVDQLVCLQVRHLREALAALGATVRFLRRLTALVTVQLRQLREVLPTKEAMRRFLLVSGLVRFQTRRVCVTFPTLVAPVWFLPGVAALMDDEVLQEPEVLAAL